MSAYRNNPQIPELPLKGVRENSKVLVNSQIVKTKGGRTLPYAQRFKYWRETDGHTVVQVAGVLEKRAREYGIDGRYLLTRLYELEQGRFKPPTWLILLLIDAYGIRFPWWEFWDGAR